MIFTYRVLIGEPFSFLNSVLPFTVVIAMSEPCHLAFVASPLPMVRTNEPLSLRISTFPFTVVIATNDWSELKSTETASPFPIVLTKEPLSLRISILPPLIYKMFIYFLDLFVLTLIGFQLSRFSAKLKCQSVKTCRCYFVRSFFFT